MSSTAEPQPTFQTTCWSTVRRAGGTDPLQAQRAMAVLCERYWYPIYAYFRRSGLSSHDAEDLTQTFFVRSIERELLAGADPDRGRLRTYLLTCARNLLSDERTRARATKRGAHLMSSFDPARAEQQYAAESIDRQSPDRLFQRRWALSVLESSLGELRAEYTAMGKGELFGELRPFLGFSRQAEGPYQAISERLKMPLGTLKSHVFRLREQWRELLFEQIAITLQDPTVEEIRAELAELLTFV